MDESGGEGIRERISARGEGALGELAQLLVDNPWMHQALQVALGARERASQASQTAIRNLNLPTGTDVDRLARRLRAVSERLEAVEDTLDGLSREVAELRRERRKSRDGEHAAGGDPQPRRRRGGGASRG
jgi:chromosome segregation ATPase